MRCGSHSWGFETPPSGLFNGLVAVAWDKPISISAISIDMAAEIFITGLRIRFPGGTVCS
jgi:hypothetical protein